MHALHTGPDDDSTCRVGTSGNRFSSFESPPVTEAPHKAAMQASTAHVPGGAPQQPQQQDGSLADLLSRLSSMETALKGEFQAARSQLKELQSGTGTLNSSKPSKREATRARQPMPGHAGHQAEHDCAWLHSRKCKPERGPAPTAAAAAVNMSDSEDEEDAGTGQPPVHASASLADWGMQEQQPMATKPAEQRTARPSTAAATKPSSHSAPPSAAPAAATKPSSHSAPPSAAPAAATATSNLAAETSTATRILDVLGPPLPQPPTFSAMGARTMHQLLSLAAHNASSCAPTPQHPHTTHTTSHAARTEAPTPHATNPLSSPPHRITAGASGTGVPPIPQNEPMPVAGQLPLASYSAQPPVTSSLGHWPGLQPNQPVLMPITSAKRALLPVVDAPATGTGLGSCTPAAAVGMTLGGAAVPRFPSGVPQPMVPAAGVGAMGQHPRPLVPAGHDMETLRKQLGQVGPPAWLHKCACASHVKRLLLSCGAAAIDSAVCLWA